MAATRLTSDSKASERRPTEPVRRHAIVLRTIVIPAAAIESRAKRPDERGAAVLVAPHSSDAFGWPIQWGTLHTPCGVLDHGPTGEIACDTDLVCAPVGESSHNICVRPCATVGDCPLPEIMLCADNLCVLDPAVGW